MPRALVMSFFQKGPDYTAIVVLRNTFRLTNGPYGFRRRSFAHFERSMACFAKIQKLVPLCGTQTV
jgi:hypothetical protein